MKKLLILFSLFCSLASAQVNVDSLMRIWKDPSLPDTVRLEAIYAVAFDGYIYSDPDSAFYFSQQQYDFAAKTGWKKYQAKALNTQGVVLYFKGELNQALIHYYRGLKILEELRDKKSITGTLNNLGGLYQALGNYPKSIECYLRSLRIADELNFIGIKAGVYNNIGAVYKNQGDIPKALEYLSLGLKYSIRMKDEQGEETAYQNLGIIYSDQRQYAKALGLFTLALRIAEKIGDDQGVSGLYGNLGTIYQDWGDDKKAEQCFEKGLEIAERMEDTQNIASTLSNLGIIHLERADTLQALAYLERAFKVANEANDVLSLEKIGQNLANCYRKKGRYREALDMFELFVSFRDSIRGERNTKEVMKQEMLYNFKKQKALEEKEHEKQLAVSEEKEQKQRVIIYSVAMGLLLVLLFALFVYNRLKITNRQKRIIELQKELVDEKQREIVDSITYAKRLQEAILPPDHFVKKHLPESFILYLPKDIVAGDFYWMEAVDMPGNQKLILLAACDCTGHGVPGAMVSVVCGNALNRSVFEFGRRKPGEILDKTRELVLETFSKSETDVKDGMDISLVAFVYDSQREKVAVEWSGANNPLWYIKDGKLHELKADKQPIGKTDNPLPFRTHPLELSHGDTFFLFTDGYADQFGGEKGKKFKYKQLEQVLLSAASRALQEQKEILEKTIHNWRGDLQQVDDILIIGVRV